MVVELGKMAFRVSLASAACALVLSVAGPAFGAAPEEELLLGSDLDEQQFADLLPFMRVLAVSGVVTGSLVDSTAMAGVPPAVMLEAERALATTVDFDRELRNGDRFYVRYEQQYSITGAPIGVGRVMWAELQLQGKRTASIHRFKPVFGPEVFYTANGQATTASPLRLPLDNIVVSSGFGIRVDPFDQPAVRGMGMGPARVAANTPWKQDASGVWTPAPPRLALGNNGVWQENNTTAGGMLPFANNFARGRTTGAATSGGGGGMAMHEGVDLVAPTGTPVHAAGDGIVRGAEPKGRYGNWVEIEHTNGVSTVYGHLQGYARGVVAGAKVSQGDVIGYVGTTGRTTGPHVHFELLLNGKPVNPITHASARRAPLWGAEIATFRKTVARDRAERDKEKGL